MDSAQIQALFAQTLTGDYDATEPWAAIHALRMSGSRDVFEYASTWCTSDDSLKRARAADVLGQLQRKHADDASYRAERVFADESYALVAGMLEDEHDAVVLKSGIAALGHLRNEAAIPLILRYQDHPDEDVRFSVTFALGCFPNNPRAIAVLVQLTNDSCSDVRDWAVFGLGVQGDTDSPEIREALLRCVDDPNSDVREEAAVALARRHDERIVPKLLSMLNDTELKLRIEDAVVALLGLEKPPAEWGAAEYSAALREKFKLQESAMVARVRGTCG